MESIGIGLLLRHRTFSHKIFCLIFIWCVCTYLSNVQAQIQDSTQIEPHPEDSTEVIPKAKVALIDTATSPLENLGKNINTEYDESAPVIAPDGRRLFFWSKRPEGMGFNDIYVAVMDDSTGNFLPSRNIGTPVNDAGANIVLSTTPDGQRLLIYKEISKKHKAEGYSDLSIAKRYMGGWQNPIPIKIEGFENTGSASLTAYLAADGKTMILSYTGPDTKGNDDLYVSTYDAQTKIWRKPINLGASINTPSSEITPFMASDGLTLYFSSDKPNGLGGFDVYSSQRMDASWTKWSPPRNLGDKVNSKGDDMHFKFPAAADLGYLVSTYPADTNYGGKDIFSVIVPNEFKPKPVTLVKGRVLEKQTQKPLVAKISYLQLPSGDEMGTAESDSHTGEYAIILPAGSNFLVLAEAEGYISITENLNTRGAKAFNNAQRDLYLAPIREGETIQMNNLFFATAKSTIHEDSYPELNRLVTLMKKHPTMRIEVMGHTDSIGTEAANQLLSTNRAEAALKYLISQGIENTRAIAKGYGSKMPLADNKTEQGRKLNRRVEFKVLGL